MHHYPFNPSDYLMQTAHLEPMEDLAYRRLLDLYYTSEAPIPKETQLVSRRLRLDTELVNKVLNEFFCECENGWSNARCDEEIASYHLKAETARINGKLGGRPVSKNKKPKKTQPVNLANPEETGSKANQNQNHINNPISLSGFEEFWKAYPKRIGKGAAEKAWDKAKINGSLQEVLAAVDRQSKSDQWQKDNGQFIPNPATWINQKRWLDGEPNRQEPSRDWI